ncbi:MAG: HAD-IB family hydrolase [Cyclobacteriaceae bacterium]
MENNSLAVFDFDGTLIKSDSFLEFIRFYKGVRNFYFGILLWSPLLVLMKARLLSNSRIKQYVLSYFFEGENIKYFNSRGDEFARRCIPRMLNPEAMEKLHWHLREGHKVLIISASAENWIKAWSDLFRVELIATKLEVKNNLLTGSISGSNCYGIEKLRRLREHVDLSAYSEIFVYGDSKGDKEILSIATDPFYRKF